tara:strand:+ start:480 stop:968 length:489 start_codon:yes stop_codon:yes gene_type:complete
MHLKRGHWVLLSLTGLVIVLLILAPKTPPSSFLDERKSEMENPPSVENDIDSALAMIQSEAPMQGILFLRSIAEEHPTNFRAQYHLGRFSAQTGQWEKVIDRFTAVQSIDPNFLESYFWIGSAHFNLGQKGLAKANLKRFVNSEKDNTQLIIEAEKLLNQIK